MADAQALLGLQATQSLHTQYKQLLQLLGEGKLLYNPTVDGNPSTVADKCELTNTKVQDLLAHMKTSLTSIKTSYQHCMQQRNKHGAQMLKLDDLLARTDNESTIDDADGGGGGGEGPKCVEYEDLYKQLQQKNADLKVVIDEVRQVFILINHLSPP